MANGNGKNGNGKGNGKASKPSQKVALDDAAEEKRRTDWEMHDALIQQAYVDLLTQNKRLPTQTEVAARCNLSRKTVHAHVSELKLTDVLPNIKWRTNTVMLGLTKKAESGSAPEVELWMMLVHGWSRTLNLNHRGRIPFEQPKSELTRRITKLLADEAEANPSPN